MKTVAGFLNGDGGDLLIGVDDDGNVLGLEDDYTARGPRLGPEAYERDLRALLENALGAPVLPHVAVSFPKVDGEALCRVTVTPRLQPTVWDPGRGPRLYVRNGDETRKLTGDDAAEYAEARWGAAAAKRVRAAFAEEAPRDAR